MTIRPLGSIIAPPAVNTAASAAPESGGSGAMSLQGGVQAAGAIAASGGTPRAYEGSETPAVGEAAHAPLHRQLRIRPDTLAAFLDFIDPDTKAVVRTVPLELRSGRNRDGDIVIRGVDTII